VEQLGATVAGIGMHHLEDAISAGSLTLERLPAAPGGPRYRFADSMLREGWDVDVGNGADAVLFLDVAPVEHEAWTALESYAIGSCEPAQRALAEGQERSLAQLEDFLDHVDALLEHAYVIHAARRLSASQAELARFAGERPAPGVDPKTHACGTAMRELLSRAACSPDRPCAAAPRVFLRDQAMIGALVDEGMPAADCAQRVGYDAVSEVVSVQREISEEVAERLDPTWSELAARAAALSTMHADLAQACTPRRRRFAEADLDEARRRMNQVIEILREDPRTASLGVWRSDVRRLALTQREEVRVFAVYDGGPASGAARAIGEVTDLREFVLEQARCSAAPDEVPLAVVVADVATDRVAHLGFHFAEELSCSELGPRSSEPSEPDAD
jgi:hypothetical protein